MMQTELEQHGGVLRWQSTLTSGTARRAASCIVLLKVVESRSQCLCVLVCKERVGEMSRIDLYEVSFFMNLSVKFKWKLRFILDC